MLVNFRTRIALSSLTVLLMAAPVAHAAAPADTSVALPFEAGQAVTIIEGYNGATHQGASVYGLDLVLANGETSGAPVVSPLDGTVAWAFEPGARNGCMEVLARDRKYGVMLCHVLLDRPFARGEKVSRGQELGTVGAPGMLGNNGAPHVHLQLQRAGRDSSPVPFSVTEGGLPLDGVDLPATGDANEHAAEPSIVSSNSAAATRL